ncbi:hypothetical protein FRC10_010980 [Ceratobasidium sp. 414]|nr:hypothetical protein FRC10_010980 [Ceratobasidium sp. 414]
MSMPVDIFADELCEPQYAALVFTKYCSVSFLLSKTGHPSKVKHLHLRHAAIQRSVQWIQDFKFDFAPSVVINSLVPGRHPWDTPWCLYNEAKMVKAKLNALEREGNQEETGRWLEERRNVVHERIKDAQPLALFLRSIDDKHNAELSDIRDQREAEVKSRLLKLGWESQDIDFCNIDWNREWKSLACIAKPLTERTWESILPTLVAHLESNRARRLERERDQRQRERRNQLYRWIDPIIGNLGPFAQALDIILSEGPSQSPASISGVSGAESRLQLMMKRVHKPWDAQILGMAYPDKDTIMSWPTFKTLEETEMTLEDLNQALQESRPTIDKLVSEWTKELEQNLIGLLPNEPSTSKDEGPSNTGHTISTQPASLIPEYALVFSTGSDTQPITSLPTDTQQLLRADSVFMRWNVVNLYPDDFHVRRLNKNDLTYSPQVAKVAKALLALLGLPDAAYLRLKAAGPAFMCGRCEGVRPMPWKELMQHYSDERAIYSRVQERPPVPSSSVKYVFMHDVDVVMPDKPLLRVVTPGTKWS